MRLVVMGVEAGGKSTVGREVAALADRPFLDGHGFSIPEAPGVARA